MAKYRKKPIVIEAIQFNGENQREIADFMGEMIRTNFFPDIYIETLEGTMKANIGDYIIKGIKGEFYPCKPDIFEATYEKVNDENSETITKETSLNVIVKSLVEGANSFIMKCPTCGRETISSQQIYIHDNIKMEWYCRNCGQKLNNHNLVK